MADDSFDSLKNGFQALKEEVLKGHKAVTETVRENLKDGKDLVLNNMPKKLKDMFPSGSAQKIMETSEHIGKLVHPFKPYALAEELAEHYNDDSFFALHSKDKATLKAYFEVKKANITDTLAKDILELHDIVKDQTKSTAQQKKAAKEIDKLLLSELHIDTKERQRIMGFLADPKSNKNDLKDKLNKAIDSTQDHLILRLQNDSVVKTLVNPAKKTTEKFTKFAKPLENYIKEQYNKEKFYNDRIKALKEYLNPESPKFIDKNEFPGAHAIAEEQLITTSVLKAIYDDVMESRHEMHLLVAWLVAFFRAAALTATGGFEFYKFLESKVVGDVHTQIIDQMMRDNPDKALEYLETNADPEKFESLKQKFMKQQQNPQPNNTNPAPGTNLGTNPGTNPGTSPTGTPLNPSTLSGTPPASPITGGGGVGTLSTNAKGSGSNTQQGQHPKTTSRKPGHVKVDTLNKAGDYASNNTYVDINELEDPIPKREKSIVGRIAEWLNPKTGKSEEEQPLIDKNPTSPKLGTPIDLNNPFLTVNDDEKFIHPNPEVPQEEENKDEKDPLTQLLNEVEQEEQKPPSSVETSIKRTTNSKNELDQFKDKFNKQQNNQGAKEEPGSGNSPDCKKS